VKIALGPASSYTAARPMPEPGRGEMNFRADGGIYVGVDAGDREEVRCAGLRVRVARATSSQRVSGRYVIDHDVDEAVVADEIRYLAERIAAAGDRIT
jgi:hypothetical protein